MYKKQKYNLHFLFVQQNHGGFIIAPTVTICALKYTVIQLIFLKNKSQKV
mgnify:CR=1 FL=1